MLRRTSGLGLLQLGRHHGSVTVILGNGATLPVSFLLNMSLFQEAIYLVRAIISIKHPPECIHRSLISLFTSQQNIHSQTASTHPISEPKHAPNTSYQILHHNMPLFQPISSLLGFTPEARTASTSTDHPRTKHPANKLTLIPPGPTHQQAMTPVMNEPAPYATTTTPRSTTGNATSSTRLRGGGEGGCCSCPDFGSPFA